MINDTASFRNWLKEHTNYSRASIYDTCSRMNRADSILTWNEDPAYLFYLEKCDGFISLSVYVKSQIRKAVKLYNEYKSER